MLKVYTQNQIHASNQIKPQHKSVDRNGFHMDKTRSVNSVEFMETSVSILKIISYWSFETSNHASMSLSHSKKLLIYRTCNIKQ